MKIKLIVLLNLFCVTLFSAAVDYVPIKAVYNIKQRAFDATAIAEIEQAIGYTFKKKSRLQKALTTKACNPAKNLEIYEYKGDVVLKMAQMFLVDKEFPKATPGQRTDMKRAIESMEPLCALGVRLGLHNYIQHKSSGITANVIEDVVEALIWAIYKDGGPQVAEAFIVRFFYPMIQGHRSFPMNPLVIIRKAQRDDKKLKGMPKACEVKKEDKKLNCAPRINSYNAAYQYVLKKLPAKYHEQLITWPLSKDYNVYEADEQIPAAAQEPVVATQSVALDEQMDSQDVEAIGKEDALVSQDVEATEQEAAMPLNIDWKSIEESPKVRLHTVCAKLGAKPHYQEVASDDGGFVSTVCIEGLDALEVKQTGMGSSKKEARDKAARKALQIMQQHILLPRELYEIDSNDYFWSCIENVNKTGSVSSCVNSMCQKYGLEKPQITTRFCAGSVDEPLTFYTTVQAPWLIKPILTVPYVDKGESYKKAYEQVLAILFGYTSQAKYADVSVKKLVTLKYIQNGLLDVQKSPVQLLQEHAAKMGKEAPVFTDSYVDVSLAESCSPMFKSELSCMKKRFAGEALPSIKAARENVARKALHECVAQAKLKAMQLSDELFDNV